MYKYGYFFFLICFSPSLLIAQSVEEKNKLYFTLKVGANISSFSQRIGEYGDGLSADYDNGFRISPLISGGAGYMINKNWGGKLEIHYTTKGGAFLRESGLITNSLGGKAYYKKIYRLDYIEFPLLATFTLPSSKNKQKTSNVSLDVGLAPCFLVASTFRYNDFSPQSLSSGPLVEHKEDFQVKNLNYAKEKNLSAVVGLSFSKPMNHTSALLDFRYTSSLYNAFNIEKQGTYNMQARLHTITVGIGLKF